MHFHPTTASWCARGPWRTEMISRAIVQIDDRRTIVSLPQATVTPPNPTTHGPSISAEQFYEAMAALDPRLTNGRVTGSSPLFAEQMETYGIEGTFKKSRNVTLSD